MDAEELYKLEKSIHRSKDLVVPSDTLRGRVVGEVRRRESGKQLADKIHRICCTLLIFIATSIMSVRSLDQWWGQPIEPVSSSDILRKANELQKESRLDPTESLAEAYSQWKMQLASHWKTNREPIP